jgi:hypothetical protein
MEMASPLADFAFYTILHPDRLDEIARSTTATELHETKRWVTAKRLFDEARASGHDVAVLYADAAFDCSKLLYWGLVQTLKVGPGGTTYTVRDLHPLRGHRTQELVLRSTQANIAEGYLRPYAIVRTPNFVAAAKARSSVAARRDVARPMQVFSFGYWGSGSATKELTDAVAAGEAARGFGLPLWVDIRISRSVRAVGFSDNALGRLLGEQYLWMRRLGNVAVAERTSGIRIDDPKAATTLLEVARERPDRRVIFFCACEIPVTCHRAEVGRLVLNAARQQAFDVEVVEWPGGEPNRFELVVPGATLRKILRTQQKTLPIAGLMSPADACVLPWGSEVLLRASDGDQTGSVLVGPVRFDARGVAFPILGIVSGDPVLAGRQLRETRGYAPLH